MTPKQQILISLNNGALALINGADGTKQDSVDIAQPLTQSPIENGDGLYFLGTDGTVHVVDRDKLN